MFIENKIIVITGAGRGIGRSMALGFAKAGAKISICSRTPSEIKNVSLECARISSKGEDAVLARACDITNQEEVSAWIQETVKLFGRIDVLVNNAGILGSRLPIVDYPSKQWREVIDVNLHGTFYVTQAALTFAMLAGGKGEGDGQFPQEGSVIINISSGVGRVGKALWGPYAVSKFACEGLTQVLAMELKDKGIRVVSFNPEATRTAMRAEAYPQEDPKILKSPEAIFDALVYLITKTRIEDSGKTFDWSNFLKK